MTNTSTDKYPAEDPRLVAEALGRRLHTMRGELRSARKQAHHSQNPKTAAIKEKLVASLERRIAEAEAQLAEAEARIIEGPKRRAKWTDTPAVRHNTGYRMTPYSQAELEEFAGLEIPAFLRRKHKAK